MATLDHEQFHVLLLDTKNYLLRRVVMSIGSMSASLVHPRETFKEAVREPAQSVMLVHNHPSGDPQPSDEDRALTRRLVGAGDILGIRVLDHVIIGMGDYFSFADQGILR
jgi:DNA repair protein RadC